MLTRRTVRSVAVVSGVGFVAGAAWVAATYESLRDGPAPMVLAMNMVLLAAILWTSRRLGLGVPAVLSRVGSALALVGLSIFLAFLTSLLLPEASDRPPSGVDGGGDACSLPGQSARAAHRIVAGGCSEPPGRAAAWLGAPVTAVGDVAVHGGADGSCDRSRREARGAGSCDPVRRCWRDLVELRVRDGWGACTESHAVSGTTRRLP